MRTNPNTTLRTNPNTTTKLTLVYYLKDRILHWCCDLDMIGDIKTTETGTMVMMHQQKSCDLARIWVKNDLSKT